MATISTFCINCSTPIKADEDAFYNSQFSDSAEFQPEMLCPCCKEDYEYKRSAREEMDAEAFYEI